MINSTLSMINALSYQFESYVTIIVKLSKKGIKEHSFRYHALIDELTLVISSFLNEEVSPNSSYAYKGNKNNNHNSRISIIITINHVRNIGCC